MHGALVSGPSTVLFRDQVLVTYESGSCLMRWPFHVLPWIPRALTRVDSGRGCGSLTFVFVVFCDLSSMRVFLLHPDRHLGEVFQGWQPMW